MRTKTLWLSVITCGIKHFYCSLMGARLNDYVIVDDISIPRADLENWRRYQTLVKSLVTKMIISIPVKPLKGNKP